MPPRVNNEWIRPGVCGTWLLPAFSDRHCHPLFAAREASAIDISACKSSQSILAVLSAHLEQNPNTSWIDASPFDFSFANELTLDSLDRISEHVPITLHSSDHHALIVNSAALRVAGLDISVPSLSNGQVCVDLNGNPTGLLMEWNAMKLVLDRQPAPTIKQDVENVRWAQTRLMNVGVISVSDAWIDPGMGEVYASAARAGFLDIAHEMWVRVTPEDMSDQMRYLDDLIQMSSGLSPNLSISGVKVFLDGVLSTKSAACLTPYLDGSIGDLVWSDAQLDEMLRKLSKISSELRPHFHAIGDRAVRQAVNSIQRARKNGIWAGKNKPVIAHAELVAHNEAASMRAMDIEVVISPQWLRASQERETLKELVSQGTFDRVGDFTELVNAGATLSYGSDWPVSDPNPLHAISLATQHLLDQGFSLETALKTAWKVASGPMWQFPSKRDTFAKYLACDQNPLEVSRVSLNELANLKFRVVQ